MERKIDPKAMAEASANAMMIEEATEDQMLWFMMGLFHFECLFGIWLTRITAGNFTEDEANKFLIKEIENVTKKDKQAIINSMFDFARSRNEFKEISADKLATKLMERVKKGEGGTKE